jgi:hypothetical protein
VCGLVWRTAPLPTRISHLYDPDLAIHFRSGLQPVGPGELLETEAPSTLAEVTERPFVSPKAREIGRITAHLMQQGHASSTWPWAGTSTSRLHPAGSPLPPIGSASSSGEFLRKPTRA